MVENFLDNIPWGDSKFVVKLLLVVFIITYVFTKVIVVSNGHFLAILVIVALLFGYSRNNIFTNEQILAKLENLSSKEFTPKYMYVDSDLIILFDNIKLDFYKYNPRVFENALKSCDNLLRLRYEMELELLPQPKIKNILENDYKEEEKEQIPKKTGLINSLQTFEAAEIQYHLCINYLHSYIVSVPSNRVLHNKFSNVIEKADILLKRNLDIIYHIYNDNRKLGDPELVEYHTQRAYNSVDTSNNLVHSFDFI